MRPLRSLVLALVLVAAGLAVAQDLTDPASIGDPYFPHLGNRGYDVQHYAIDVDVDLDSNTLDARVGIDAEATDTLASFNLDFVGFDISALTVNGAPAAFERTDTELVVTPDTPLAAGDVFTVDIAYTGMPLSGNQLGGAPIPSEGWFYYGDGVFVASEPGGASWWFPCNDHPLDKATFTLRLTVPEGNVAASNGELTGETTEGGKTTFVWEMRQPMATYLATVNITDFARVEDESVGSVTVRNFFPEELAERGEEVFDRQPEMIAFFADRFGPYPFDSYGSVVADIELPFALETQTLSLFGRNILSSLAAPGRAEITIAHELAHQWFGNSVSLARWQDIWLNEGFASYAHSLWIEHVYGEDAFTEYMAGLYAMITEEPWEGMVVPGAPPRGNLFDRAVYDRGALTLYALHLKLGDTRFFDVLRTYAERYRYANATTEDFIAVAEEISGEELDDFFEGWLYTRAVPDIPKAGLRNE